MLPDKCSFPHNTCSTDYMATIEDDKPHEECGVFGIWAPQFDVARLTFFGLQALQHRGQESAGIAVSGEHGIKRKKDLGLAREIFSDQDIEELQGFAAIGHVRYSTSGKDPQQSLLMAHPHLSQAGNRKFALAHNGTLTNMRELRCELARYGDAEEYASDSKLAANLLGAYAAEATTCSEGIARMMNTMQGAYAMVVLSESALYAFRDFCGIRPLCLGRLPQEAGWVVASESCALDIVGASYERDVEPGELITIDASGLHSELVQQTADRAPQCRASCLFEYVYFARPDSVIDGANIYRAREAMGRRLFHEAPIEADIVIGVPDSGIPAAIGYARESGVVYSEGIIKNRYVDRTFIKPTQELREQSIRLKLSPLHYALRNRRVIVIDDSIVRGSTSKQLVQMLRDAGAAEIHLRISSPAIVWPCFLGINTDTQEQLIAATKSVDEICDYVGADSLAYLSLEGMKSCIYAQHPEYCTACFDGCYPTPLPDPLPGNAFLPDRLTEVSTPWTRAHSN